MYNRLCDPLLENLPNYRLLQNEIEARKVDVITVVDNQMIFYIQ